MMFLIPYDKITFTTNRTRAEITNILNKNTVGYEEYLLCIFGDFTKNFMGRVGNDSFKIFRRVSYRNSFIVMLDGKIREKGEIREVTMTIRMAYIVYILFAAIFGILINQIVRSILYHAEYGVYYENTAGFVWAVIIIYVVMIAVFRYSAYEAKERFFEII